LPKVLFGFAKYVKTLKITVLFKHYKQATDRKCVFCIWSDKITKWYQYNRNTGGKVAVIRRECETYTTVVLFIKSIACWDFLTNFEYSDMCGKCWTMICCVFCKYIRKTYWYFNPESSSDTWQYMWNTIYIVF
jgi:hypothetical protein